MERRITKYVNERMAYMSWEIRIISIALAAYATAIVIMLWEVFKNVL